MVFLSLNVIEGRMLWIDGPIPSMDPGHSDSTGGLSLIEKSLTSQVGASQSRHTRSIFRI